MSQLGESGQIQKVFSSRAARPLASLERGRVNLVSGEPRERLLDRAIAGAEMFNDATQPAGSRVMHNLTKRDGKSSPHCMRMHYYPGDFQGAARLLNYGDS